MQYFEMNVFIMQLRNKNVFLSDHIISAFG